MSTTSTTVDAREHQPHVWDQWILSVNLNHPIKGLSSINNGHMWRTPLLQKEKAPSLSTMVVTSRRIYVSPSLQQRSISRERERVGLFVLCLYKFNFSLFVNENIVYMKRLKLWLCIVIFTISSYVFAVLKLYILMLLMRNIIEYQYWVLCSFQINVDSILLFIYFFGRLNQNLSNVPFLSLIIYEPPWLLYFSFASKCCEQQ